MACLMFTSALYLQLYSTEWIHLSYGLVFKRFQIWRLITNFFFLGQFSFPFAMNLFIILKYGVSLERGPFDKRTADYVWMLIFGALSLLVMAAVPFLYTPFMGTSLVFMIVYVWGREFANERINSIWPGLTEGLPLKPCILGMVVGHLYYFLTVLYPLSGGKYAFKTPLWVHKVVAFWGEGTQFNAPVQRDPFAGVSFRGRSYRLNGSTRTSTRTNTSEQQPNPAAGDPFRGRSYRLSGH
ncbi:hypothetical protein L1049_020865 [Liquidambar formosana]|uniref:Derlin n=1 Tax=Liquidambar formosana TaxID=63359 RepID=A0AAP0X4P5_LIQFO